HQTAKPFIGNGNLVIGKISSNLLTYTLKAVKEILLPLMRISNEAYYDLVKEIEIELYSGKA
ncbi:49_t:CDS:1, partial [Scutellospora calospora]